MTRVSSPKSKNKTVIAKNKNNQKDDKVCIHVPYSKETGLVPPKDQLGGCLWVGGRLSVSRSPPIRFHHFIFHVWLWPTCCAPSLRPN